MTEEEYEALVALLDRELVALVRRLHAWPARAWRAAAPPFADRAAAAHHVARMLAIADQGVETGGAERPRPWRQPPSLPAHALADQVAVTGHDLVQALAAVGPDTQAWGVDGRHSALGVARWALGEVLLHRHDLDGAMPGRAAAAAAGVGSAAPEVLDALRERCAG